MKVRVKDLQVSMELGNNGIELELKDNSGKHIGDLRIGRATVEWCKGKIRKDYGIKLTLHELIEMIESRGE